MCAFPVLPINTSNKFQKAFSKAQEEYATLASLDYLLKCNADPAITPNQQQINQAIQEADALDRAFAQLRLKLSPAEASNVVLADGIARIASLRKEILKTYNEKTQAHVIEFNPNPPRFYQRWYSKAKAACATVTDAISTLAAPATCVLKYPLATATAISAIIAASGYVICNPEVAKNLITHLPTDWQESAINGTARIHPLADKYIANITSPFEIGPRNTLIGIPLLTIGATVTAALGTIYGTSKLIRPASRLLSNAYNSWKQKSWGQVVAPSNIVKLGENAVVGSVVGIFHAGKGVLNAGKGVYNYGCRYAKNATAIGAIIGLGVVTASYLTGSSAWNAFYVFSGHVVLNWGYSKFASAIPQLRTAAQAQLTPAAAQQVVAPAAGVAAQQPAAVGAAPVVQAQPAAAAAPQAAVIPPQPAVGAAGAAPQPQPSAARWYWGWWK